MPAPDELPAPVAAEAPPLVARPRRSRWCSLVAGGVAGFARVARAARHQTYQDQDGTLSVTVPMAWARDVSLDGWTPPDTHVRPVGAGGRRPCRLAASGQGVFVGLLPETKLPKKLPQHPSCTDPGVAKPGSDGDPSLTAVSTGCPGGGVILERAEQVSATRLLWVQVRSDDQKTAEDVLLRAHFGLG